MNYWTAYAAGFLAGIVISLVFRILNKPKQSFVGTLDDIIEATQESRFHYSGLVFDRAVENSGLTPSYEMRSGKIPMGMEDLEMLATLMMTSSIYQSISWLVRDRHLNASRVDKEIMNVSISEEA